MKIRWIKTRQDNMVGRFEDYRIEISKQNHGGYSYDLTFEGEYKRLILARHGRKIFYIKTLHAAKYHSLKKLNFFYAQQKNNLCSQ